MAKGGRYLNTNQKTKERKKGKGWKIALIVLVILLLIIGGVVALGMNAFNSILDKVQRAEFVEQTISEKELEDLSTFNFDLID